MPLPCKLTRCLQRATCDKIALNRKVLRLRRCFLEVDRILNHEDHHGKCRKKEGVWDFPKSFKNFCKLFLKKVLTFSFRADIITFVLLRNTNKKIQMSALSSVGRAVDS